MYHAKYLERIPSFSWDGGVDEVILSQIRLVLRSCMSCLGPPQVENEDKEWQQ